MLPHYMIHQPPRVEAEVQEERTISEEEKEQSRIDARNEERRKLGIAPGWFVFACFNQGKKVDARMFSTWVSLLLRFQDSAGVAAQISVLWLPQVDNANAQEYLRREAASKGLLPSRLIFSGKRVNSRREHLARLAAADVALDSARYSAGSVGVEAFLQGVPLVVLASDSSVASRQASAVALTLSDKDHITSTRAILPPSLLIATNFKEYAETALRLATVLRRTEGDSFSLAHMTSKNHLNYGCRAAAHKCALEAKDRATDIERGSAAAFEANTAKVTGHIFFARECTTKTNP